MADNYGWYLLHRGWMDNDVFSDKEFCDRMAWVWLIDNACWRPKKIRVLGKTIELKRGQLSYSRSFLAKAWGWNDSKVWRYLHRMKTEQMIEQDNEQVQSIITICNYDKYQNFFILSNSFANDKRTEIEQNKKEIKESKEDNNKATGGKNGKYQPKSGIEGIANFIAQCSEEQRQMDSAGQS